MLNFLKSEINQYNSSLMWGMLWGTFNLETKKGSRKNSETLVICVVAGEGFEPTTFGL